MNQKLKTAITFLHCAGLIYIENRKLLLAYSNNKKCFYLPGGKVDADESAIQALCREIAEEMNVVINEKDLRFFTHISAPAYGETTGIIMEQDCYFLNLKIAPIASAEIAALQYFSLEEYLTQVNQAPGAIMILEQLKAENYID